MLRTMLVGVALTAFAAPAAAQEPRSWFAPGRTWSSLPKSEAEPVRRIQLRGDDASWNIRRVRIGLELADGSSREGVARCRPASYAYVCDLEDGPGRFRLQSRGCQLILSFAEPVAVQRVAARGGSYTLQRNEPRSCRVLR